MSAGGRPPPLRRTGIGALTPTERRVATMVAKEMTNREIARELYVTEKTIETHLTNAFRKLDLRSRQDLGRLVTIEWDEGRFHS
jgi:DNA-binding CsgD family transcriptional regulator